MPDDKAIGGVKCIICGCCEHALKFEAVEDLEYNTYGPVDYLVCQSCGLISQYPAPAASLIASFYPVQYRNYMPLQRNLFMALKLWQAKSFARQIAGHLDSGLQSTILDVGFGNGQLLLALSDLGFSNLYGCDFTNRAFQYLEEKGLKLAVANIEETFPFEEKFDCIIMNNVIEHFLNPVAVLALARKHLSSKGVVILVTPNGNAFELSLFGKRWAGFHAPRHTFVFSDRNIGMLARSLNFSSIKVEPFMDPGQWSISLQNILQSHSSTKTNLTHGLAWYSTPFSLILVPVVAAQGLLNKSTAIFCTLKA